MEKEREDRSTLEGFLNGLISGKVSSILLDKKEQETTLVGRIDRALVPVLVGVTPEYSQQMLREIDLLVTNGIVTHVYTGKEPEFLNQKADFRVIRYLRGEYLELERIWNGKPFK